MDSRDDEYRTIRAKSEGLYKEKGSKFISLAFPVKDEIEIKAILQELRKSYYDARHHCYAYRLEPDKKKFRSNDDGEPSGSAGKPILGQLLSFDLTDTLIVVIRYFGGTKLGVSGLINAYRTAARDAIENTTILTKTEQNIYSIKFDYIKLNDVMKIIKDEKPEVLFQEFEMDCQMTLSIRISEGDKFIGKLKKVETLTFVNKKL
ncbi:MAG: YigZ family protein [Bacteroidota bacterium]|nr:YigZ family protein [Bacteroidota bacterium]